MSPAPPRSPALAGEPVAVLLLDTSAGDGDGPAVLAAHTSVPAPAVPAADLAGFLRTTGLGDLAAGSAWRRVADGLGVPGERLPGGPGPDLWLRAVPLDGAGRTLVTVQRPEDAGAGTALSVLRGSAWVVEWVDEAHTRATGTPAQDAVGRPAPRSRPGVRTTGLTDRSGRVRHLVSHLPAAGHADASGRGAGGRDAADEAARTREALTAHRLELLVELDTVVVADGSAGGVLGGLEATVRVLTEHVVQDALLALTVERPGGPRGVDAEVVAVSGPRFAGLAGHRLRRGRGPRPHDPLLRRPDGARAEPVDLLRLDTDTAAPSAWLAVLASSVGASTALAVPLVGREEVVGLLVVVPRATGEASAAGDLDAADTAVLVGAARRAGLLVEGARFPGRRPAAEEEEAPPRPPVARAVPVEGLDVWSSRPADDDRPRAGGDWWDLLSTGPEVVTVVVGDVVDDLADGSVDGPAGADGPPAADDPTADPATTTDRVRTVVRAAAGDLDDPGEVLRRVDDLAGAPSASRRASAVVARLRRQDDGGWELAWSSAGHLPPLLRRAPGPDEDGRVEVLSEATGTLLGLGGRPRPTRDRALAPGDTVVLYTEGLIEQGSGPDREGLKVLADALLASRALDAAELGEELLAGLGEAPGDATLVVVRVPPDGDLDADGRRLTPADTPRRRRWQLPAEASSVGKARHATLRASSVWGLANGLQAEIVVSELVANAVLHGWGTVGLRLFDLPTGLRIEVEDDSPEGPRVVPARPDGGGGHGMRVVERLGRWGWTPTRRGKIVWVELHPAPAPAPVPDPDPDPKDPQP